LDWPQVWNYQIFFYNGTKGVNFKVIGKEESYFGWDLIRRFKGYGGQGLDLVPKLGG